MTVSFIKYEEEILKSKGFFITFEGIEGSGKTTQARLLADYLSSIDFSVLLTREPGGSVLSEKIREILIDPRSKQMKAKTECLLYAASRAQHVEEIILPAIADGKTVISDRFADATLAYQGYGRMLPIKMLRQLNDFATGGLEPNLTFLLDLPVETGLARTRKRGNKLDRLEQEAIDFHQRVRQGYLKIAKQACHRFKIIDASLSVEEIQDKIKDYVLKNTMRKK